MVYEAVDTVQKEPVVLRRYETTDLSQAEIRRLGKEIRFLERFPGAGRHHIVEYRGSFETAEHIYIVTENCTQGDLLRELTLSKDHSLSEEFVRDKVALGVVKALAFLHKHRIAHTDIKPENLFLTKSNQVKLGDLNLATDLMEGPAVHREGVVDYMAPEMIVIPGSGAGTRPEAANRIRSYNEKADIWQVGILVYELLTGSPPFEAEDVNLTASLILWGEVESYPLYMSANAIDFVRQCLTKDPGARPDAVVLLRHPWLQKRQQAYSGLGNALTRTMTMRTAKVAAAKSPGESEASEKASTSAGDAAAAGDAAPEGRVRGIMRQLGLLRTMPDTQTRALFDQAGTHLSEAKLAKIFSVNKGANGSP
uniref:Kinase-like protein n=1 Tax=Tetraselmis sp. GSL018 TaxID=582737 RepID=A0A061QR88_9CHLO